MLTRAHTHSKHDLLPLRFFIFGLILIMIFLVVFVFIKHWDQWMDGLDGWLWAGQARPGQAIQFVWIGLMRGALKSGGLLPLSHFPRGDGCLSLDARYQRAFWEFVPQGPPWSSPCLSLSYHILAFFSPLTCFIPLLDLPCIFSTVIAWSLTCWELCHDVKVIKSLPSAWIALVRRSLIIHNACFFF